MQDDDAAARCAEAWEIWLRCGPVRGTLADRYLRETLGIAGEIPDVLAFHPNAWCSHYGDHLPALCAPIFGAGGHPTAVLQTFLCSETLDSWKTLSGDPVTELVGEPYRGAVWTGCPGPILGVAVGLEAALASQARYSLPVWAASDRERLRKIRIPDQVRTLLVFDGKTSDAPRTLHRSSATAAT
jgi:putative DNA primase/helicase